MQSKSPQPAKSQDRVLPASACIVGCGLIGVSFAMSLKRAFPEMRLVGVDVNAMHRTLAQEKGVFDHLAPQFPEEEETFHLGILAVPPSVAEELLLDLAQRCDVVMDVCSIKGPLCQRAEDLGLGERFAPSHPMAGIASEGPKNADGELFRGNPWILLKNWPACKRVEGIVAATGASLVWLEDAKVHDAAMAAVSHGIHVTSLSAMLAYDEARESLAGPAPNVAMAKVTGPGFRDITRLADSPSGFWVDTLLANRVAVMEQIQRTQDSLQAFKDALLREDEETLRGLLNAARAARERWREEH